MTDLDKLIYAIEHGEKDISSYAPIEHEKVYKAMNGSLDAAKDLHDALLLEGGATIDVKRNFAFVSIPDGDFSFTIAATSTNAACAWLIAILRAYRDQQE
jgi:hypothetical protein